MAYRRDVFDQLRKSDQLRRRAAPALALTALLSLGLLAGCSGEGPNSAPGANPTVSAPTEQSSKAQPSQEQSSPADDNADGPDASSTAKPSLPPDPKAPTTVQPVKRSGSTSGKRITAESATFAKAIRWSDGVRLQVVDLEQGVTNGVGAGSTQGAPVTTFSLKLTNDSDKTVDVSSVVLTTVYGGKSKLIAQPVYDQGTSDFSGTVAPGKSAAASYAYTIPTKQLGSVSLTVDLDGHHALASFRGSAR